MLVIAINIRDISELFIKNTPVEKRMKLSFVLNHLHFP